MRISRRHILTTFLLVLLTVQTASSVLKLGVILPETGRLAETALAMRTGFELALESIHYEESALEILFADNFADPDSARSAAERFAARGDISLLTGGFPSECCVEVAEIARNYDIPYLIIAASADTLTKGSDRNIFRISPPSTDYNDGLIGWAVTATSVQREIAILYDDHPKWEEALKDLQNDLKARWKGKVDFFPFSLGERDFGDLIERIEPMKPGLVWLISGANDAVGFIRQCEEHEWAPAALVLGTVKYVNSRVIISSYEVTDLSYAPAVWFRTHPYPDVEHFTTMFNERMGETPDYRAAEAFAAGQVIIDLEQRSEGHSINSVRESLIQTDLMTVIGQVKFEDFRDFNRQNRVRTCAMQLQGGKWVTVWPLQLATADYIYPIPDWRYRKSEKADTMKPMIYTMILIILIALLLVSGAKKRRDLLDRMDE
ncbi:ABC transporter substrate-binding protein [bacterium]|nr:ABC transporter substrate-binding protein [bacterium]